MSQKRSRGQEVCRAQILTRICPTLKPMLSSTSRPGCPLASCAVPRARARLLGPALPRCPSAPQGLCLSKPLQASLSACSPHKLPRVTQGPPQLAAGSRPWVQGKSQPCGNYKGCPLWDFCLSDDWDPVVPPGRAKILKDLNLHCCLPERLSLSSSLYCPGRSGLADGCRVKAC